MEEINILLDVDGVLANFDQLFVHIAKNIFDIKFVQHPGIWDYYEYPEVAPFKDKIMEYIVQTPGMVRGMDFYECAHDLVRVLRKEADNVIACTDSAYPGIFATERIIWLMEEFGFKREDIIFSGRKYLIDAWMLIDDKPSNIEKWVRHHPDGVGVLWHPATREYRLYISDKSISHKVLKASDYQEILKFL